MKSYKVIVSINAIADLDDISDYIASIYRPESGHNFVNRILGQLQALSYSAGTYRKSPYKMAKLINPEAKTISIVRHRWTAIFHIEGNYVIIDRIMPSSTIV